MNKHEELDVDILSNTNRQSPLSFFTSTSNSSTRAWTTGSSSAQTIVCAAPTHCTALSSHVRLRVDLLPVPSNRAIWRSTWHEESEHIECGSLLHKKRMVIIRRGIAALTVANRLPLTSEGGNGRFTMFVVFDSAMDQFGVLHSCVGGTNHAP